MFPKRLPPLFWVTDRGRLVPRPAPPRSLPWTSFLPFVEGPSDPHGGSFWPVFFLGGGDGKMSNAFIGLLANQWGPQVFLYGRDIK